MLIIDKQILFRFSVFLTLIIRNQKCWGATISDVNTKNMALNIDLLVNISRNHDGDLLTTQQGTYFLNIFYLSKRY